jgi:hypothetical protein
MMSAMDIQELVNRHRLQAQTPGAVFGLNGAISRHHDVATYRWNLGPAGAPPLASGSDVLFLAGDRIRTVYVFID